MNPYGYFDNEYINEQMDKEEKKIQERIELETARLRQRVSELEFTLNALSQRHMWHPEGGGCQCEDHKKAYELLKGTEFEDAQRRAKGWM